MAWAQYDPITQAKVNRQRSINAAANSPDPLIRYQAKDQILYEGMAEAASGLIAQAKQNARAQQAYERELDRIENSKYKPLRR